MGTWLAVTSILQGEENVGIETKTHVIALTFNAIIFGVFIIRKVGGD